MIKSDAFNGSREVEQRHQRQRKAVSELIQSAAMYEGDCDAVMRQITETAARTLGVARVSIWQYNKECSAIRCLDLFELNSQSHTAGAELSAKTHPAYFRAMGDTEIIAANDAGMDPRTREFANDYLALHGITSMLDAPVHVAGRVDGVLCHEHVGEPRAWTEDEKSFAVTLANLISLAAENAERRRTELALRSSERRFSEVFRANPAAMSINTVDDGSILDVNARYCEFFGYGREELIGKSILDLRLWANPDDRLRMIDRLRRDKTIREMEAQYRHKSGAIRDVLGSFVLLDVPGEGQPIIVSMFFDITDRKRLEEQLRQSQKLESIGQLAGGVAHDFNNILTVIQGHASLLLATPGGLPGGESAEQIARSAERAANLTRQLLAFSRRQVMQPKDLDLNDIVRDMTKMLNRILGEDIRLQVEFHANLPMVWADPGMMEQVILNLAVNARDAMPKGGSLRIVNTVETIDAEEAKKNSDACAGTFVHLSVADSGCGIPPHVLPHIFEPFFTTKEVGKGTGLGLATVYGIVKQHRGWIKLQTEVNRGATFHIYLPASDTAPKVQEKAAPSKHIPRGAETVLIVEDELSVRLLTRRVLQTLGYKVLEACDGDSALEVWKENFPIIDLVLTDMVMPGGMSGTDLVAELLHDKPQVKVIFCSGHSVELFGKELSLKAGMSFLQKPYDSTKLAQAVRACLDSGVTQPAS